MTDNTLDNLCDLFRKQVQVVKGTHNSTDFHVIACGSTGMKQYLVVKPTAWNKLPLDMKTKGHISHFKHD